MFDFLLTMAVGLIVGYLFLKLKVPGGMMVGSIVGVAALNIAAGMAYMPYSGRLAAQIIAGAFIGVGLEKGDLSRLKNIYKPAMTLIIGMLILNIISGFLIYLSSPLDLVTSFMSAVPGGMSDVPIISEDMGADSSMVALMQFVRLVFGIGIFPSMINKISKLKFYKEEEENEIYKRITTNSDSLINLAITVLVALVFGVLGKISGIPAATLVFAMISIIVLKLTTGRACMPKWMRRFAQLLAGAYIGSSIEMAEVLEMRFLVLPIIILITGYFVACLIIGNTLHHKFKMRIDESMLAATPAGASDMALISADIGIESSDLIVLQIIRMVTAVSVFPQIIRLIVSIAS